MTAATQPKATPQLAIVIYGWPNPTTELPQASWFRAEDKAAAKAAAAELKFGVALAPDRSGEGAGGGRR